jgi:hypothetical protein
MNKAHNNSKGERAMQATIQFKAKVHTMNYVDETFAYQYIPIPSFTRGHCNMPAFRSHAKYGSFANSDLFQGVLNKIKKNTFGDTKWLRLDRIPENVTVDLSGFLAHVIITVEA